MSTSQTVRQLYKAISEQDFAKIQDLVTANASIAVSPLDDMLPIHAAAKIGSIDILRLLLKHGANVNAESESGATAIHYSVLEKHTQASVFLIDSGADVKKPCRFLENATCLHLCSELPRPANLAAHLIDSGANIEASADDGRKPLHDSIRHKSDIMMRLLIDHDANPNSTDANGRTPLHYAAVRGNTKFARYLLLHGANANALDNQQATPIRVATQEAENPASVCKEIHKQGGKIDIYSAAALGKSQLIKSILSDPSNATADFSKERDLLSTGVRSGNAQVVSQLLSVGCNPNDSSALALPLHEALYISDHDNLLKILQILLKHGADPSHRKDGQSQTPLQSARKMNLEAYSILSEHKR